MKKEEKHSLILKEQSKMKVVLNGGGFELDDATIPFQIGFGQSVAKKSPAHILVLDITELDTPSFKRGFDCSSERTLYKLEPIHYLQLKKPGIHHLVFILFEELTPQDQRCLLEKENRYCYDFGLFFNKIENDSILAEQICYAEVVVSVPEAFFAKAPETKIGKAIFRWCNSWYDFEPIDQCEYRKRKIIGLTIKPILWMLGFLLRIVPALLAIPFTFVVKVFAFILGYQAKSFIYGVKKIWIDFLFLYPRFSVEDLLNYYFNKNDDVYYFYQYKRLVIRKRSFHLGITIWELCLYLGFLLFYFAGFLRSLDSLEIGWGHILFFQISLSFIFSRLFIETTLPSFRKDDKWEEKWGKYITDERKKKKDALSFKISGFFSGVAILYFLVTKISWSGFWNFLCEVNVAFIAIGIIAIVLIVLAAILLFKKLRLHFNKEKSYKSQGYQFSEKKNITNQKKIGRLELKRKKHEDWLRESFDIKKVQNEVDMKKTNESSSIVHVFTVKFWQMKAKVCKPYPKK